MKKKMGWVMLSLALALAMNSSPVIAAAGETIPVSVNGVGVSAQAYRPIWDATHSRVLIRPAFFADYFGAEVSFDAGVVTISKNGHTISFTESETRFVMDGIGGRNLASANIVQSGEMYIPLRFMCESLDAQVEWDGNAAAVNVGDSTLPDAAAAYLQGVTVFDQSTIRLAGDKTLYIDPYRIAGEPHDADVILVTHTHGDHFDMESIQKVMKDATVLLIAGEGGSEKAAEGGANDVIRVVPNQEYTAAGITIKTIPAYNTSPDRQNHRPEHNFVGYVVAFNGVTYYAAGDTDYIPDMDDLDVDVAFLPIDGRFNMEETEAARAANAIAPKVAVPYHYNNFSSEARARHFLSLLDESITGAVMTFKMHSNNETRGS